MDSQCNTSTASFISTQWSSSKEPDIYLPITVIGWTFPVATEANIQVCTRTEDLARARQDNNLDPFVDVKHGEEFFEIIDHLPSEGIVVGWSVQSHDNDRGYRWCASWMMRDFDMTRGWDSLVRGWKLDGCRVKDHGVRI